LAVAAHFQSVLSASDLSESYIAGSSISLTALSFSIARFVPFTIFVSSATLAIILVLCVYHSVPLQVLSPFVQFCIQREKEHEPSVD
jgi:hypothetical protein